MWPYLNSFFLLLQRPVSRQAHRTKPWTTLTTTSQTSSPTAPAIRKVTTTSTTTSSTTSTTTSTSTSTSSPSPTTRPRLPLSGHSSVSSKPPPIYSPNQKLKLEQFSYKTTSSFFTIIAVFLNYYSNCCVT